MNNEIRASISINAQDLANLVSIEAAENIDIDEKIQGWIDNNSDYIVQALPIDDQIQNWFENDFDIDDVSDKINDVINEYMSSDFDIEDYLSNVDLSEYIDHSELEVDEHQIRDLLGSYNPGNGCSTGNAFTDALARGFKYLAHHETDEIKQTLRWLLRDVIKEEIEKIDVRSMVQLSIMNFFVEAFKPSVELAPDNSIQVNNNSMPHINYGF